MRAFAAAAVLAALASIPAGAVQLSSSAISDPHELIRGTATITAGVHKELTKYPEHLVFNVSWGLISVGKSTLEVTEIVDFGGRPAYHIVSRAESNGFCDTFYKVRDINESWLDAERFVTLGYSKKLREGHFFRDEWVLYDAATQGEQEWLSKTTNRDGSFGFKSGTASVTAQDVLSSVYFVRSQKLEPGMEFSMDVNTRQNWPMVVRVKKRERIKTPAGKFDTVLVEPAMRGEGIFIQKGKKLEIWLTDDDKKMPVQMRVEVFFGHITAKLAKVL
jgi:hypothetical protein